jgi:hypothetical protein
LESWCLGMLRECLVYSSMRLGDPFIAPRQLGAVESIPGRQFLPSVAWRTGQSGAPPDTVRCGFLSFFGEADRWRFRAVGAPDTVWCTPDSPVHTGQSGAPFWPLALPRVARGLRGRPLARPTVGSPDSPVHHRTVRWFIAVRRWSLPESDDFACEWLTGQSGAPPDSLVIYSRTQPSKSREQPVDRRQPGAPDTVRCTTGHCPVHHWTVRCPQTEQSTTNFSIIVSPISST